MIMKIAAYLFCLLFAMNSAFSQTFAAPESVVFDPINQVYIISFAGSGALGIQADSSAPISLFAAGLTSPKGMVIYDTVLYVTDVTNVKAYGLEGRQKIAQYDVPGAQFLNDIAADDFGILYVSDMNANKIIRIDPLDESVETLLTTPYQAPNGLYWDMSEQLLYVVYFSTTQSPIQSIDVDTKEVKDVYPAEFSRLDGITIDFDGNIYVSSWATDSVYCFLGGFDIAPIAIQQKFTSPADIYYDEFNNMLVIPCMNINKLYYLDVTLNEEEFPITLISPVDGAEGVNPMTKFEWQPIPGIDKYYILVYSLGGYELLDSTDKASYTMTEELPNPDEIYWSITGFKGDTMYSSEIWMFTTGIIDGVHELEVDDGIKVSPNPVSTSAIVSYNLDKPSDVSLCVFNSIGCKIASLAAGEEMVGTKSIVFNCENLAPGVYYYILNIGGTAHKGKFVVAR
jgi:hypothetical protein